MRFNMSDYKGKYVMHCKTEEEANEFCDYMHNIGRKWSIGLSYNKANFWNTYKSDTCYNFNENVYLEKKYYKQHGYTILEWSDFTTEFTKADLKDGMVVEIANGEKYLVLEKRLVNHSGWLRINDYDDDLRDNDYDDDYGEWTINKVYKCSSVPIIARIFDDTFLTLIWERKPKPEPVEMTLEEICKALGKEVKIVKG